MEELKVGDSVKIADDSPLARRILKESNAGDGGYKYKLFGKTGVIDSERNDDHGHHFHVTIGPFNIAWWWPPVLLEKFPAEECENIHHVSGVSSYEGFMKSMEAVAKVEPPHPGVSEIVFDHVARDGKCMFQIAEIRGVLTPDKLPDDYLASTPMMHLYGVSSFWISYLFGEIVSVGQLLTEEEAAKLVKRMRACGKRLHDINVAARAKADEERLERWLAKGRKVVRI
jgi:hypothetical protein